MRTWSEPRFHTLGSEGVMPRFYNSANARFEHAPLQDNKATLYVCGITPYDATHLGHAFTYLTFDLMQRAWLDAGVDVVYAQNITDVDDPLLERAHATKVKWRDLAAEQIALFRSDMHSLAMLPPQHYVPVTEQITEIAAAVQTLLDKGYAYRVPVMDVAPETLAAAPTAGGNPDTAATTAASQSAQEQEQEQAATPTKYDIYFDHQAVSAAGVWQLGDVIELLPEEYLRLSELRGGDPEREGKHHPLDPLLWRAKRKGEPSWETVLGKGRPGWHIECSVIAAQRLGTPFTVQGGGEDLRFPHHEFSAANAAALYGTPLAHIYSHVALVSYQGHKMSKSRGNLVFVHKLLRAGYTGSEIRLALLNHHYRSSWEWFDQDIVAAKQRLALWEAGFKEPGSDPQTAIEVVTQLRAALANDLDTPLMLAIINQAAQTGVDDPDYLVKAVENLLGVTIYSTPETGMIEL